MTEKPDTVNDERVQAAVERVARVLADAVCLDIDECIGSEDCGCDHAAREALAALRPGDVLQSRAGKTVEIKTGEKITVALSGVPTAGYVWAVSSPPAFVKVTDGPGGATSSAQFTPGFAGGNHWEVVIIEATAAGEAEITLAQRRPWEDKAEPDASTFKFKLKAS